MFLAKAITVILTIFIVLIGFIAISGRNKRDHSHGEITLTSMNDNFEEMKDAIESVVIDSEVYKQQIKAQHKQDKKDAKERKKQAKADAKQAKIALKTALKTVDNKSDEDQKPAVQKFTSETEDEQSIIATPKSAAHDSDNMDEDLASESRGRVFVLDFNGDIRASEVDLLREEISAVLSFAADNDEIVLRLDSAGGMVHTYGLAASQLERIKSASIKLTICVDEVAASGGYMMA
jgi:serine protease SohB